MRRSSRQTVEALAGLATLTTCDPRELRESVLSVVLDVAGADSALLHGVASLNGVPHVVESQWVGNSCVVAGSRFVEQHPELRPAVSRESFLQPSSIATRAFLDIDAISCGKRHELEETAHWEGAFHANGMTDQTRLLVFHGRQMICLLGAYRRGGPNFGPTERRRLAPLVPAVISVLVAADHLDARNLPSEQAFLTTFPDGSVECSTRAAEGWLSRPGFRESLTSAVRAFDRGDEHEPTRLLRGAEARLLRLDGHGGVRYLVCLTPAPPLLKLASAALSPAQRQVAELAAAGATVAEIGRALAKSRDTVKSHLRSVYERLEVSSRVELARALKSAK